MYKIVLYFEIAFVIEDIFLEILYIYHFWQYLQDVPAHVGVVFWKRNSRTFYLLLIASLIVILCDIVGLILLFLKIFLLRYSVIGLLYGIKMHTEVLILNRLVDTINLKNEVLRRGNISDGAAADGTTANSTGDGIAARFPDAQSALEGQYLELKPVQVATAIDLVEPLQYGADVDIIQNVSSRPCEQSLGGGTSGNVNWDYSHAGIDDLERQYLGRSGWQDLEK
jgi:hypothetical protein